ncbi:MAG: NUDIX hydrolase [Rhizobiales bacterium]|nr:NUDIX hydrolase [Hyphomicrobiales bacterium]MBO6698248.1 NUDIX hydrolase [Hyphomicrobiales bacterium]MBO6735498.1 NUDIX hydrolase [Hyphomicrobiales bacterium]MBO6910694.1 NUDIX hydrolase [Hyphomicrobiales bacterium]MBO6957226.1 NUDIX hydrolase [Hyphomicrobiales bacterium]
MPSLPDNTGPRLAARALIVENERLLMVNAYPGGTSDLWCAPGGGVEKHQSIPDNLKREVFEETGLTIDVGGLAGINEFHDPDSGFHQVDLFFRAAILDGKIDPAWRDPDNVVSERRFMSRLELNQSRHKPDRLADFAFGRDSAAYDPLELLVR